MAVNTLPRFIPWQQCVGALNDSSLQMYAAWRGFSWPFCLFLRSEHLIGLYSDFKTGTDYFCYPVFGPGGMVIAEQVFTQSSDPTAPKAFMTAGAKGHLSPVVLGPLPHATSIFPSESPHDVFAFADRSGLWKDPDACFIATRGAANNKLLGSLPWPQPNGRPPPDLFLLCQNDTTVSPDGLTANQRWLKRVAPSLPFAYYPWNPPAPHKDFNDWTRAGVTETELFDELVRIKKSRPPHPPGQGKIKGHSLFYYAKRKIDHTKTLLGDRWLSRGRAAIIVAPSSHGKSSFAVQLAILVSCGRPAFALRPPGPLRILIVQAEDDDNDVTEMANMVRRLGLTAAEEQMVERNTLSVCIDDMTGETFIDQVDQQLEDFSADILLINPISSYVSKDLRDEQTVHEFFRVWLTPILKKHDCGLVGIHHTPKTNFSKTEDYDWYDWMYSGAGHATLTNWARAAMVIVPTALPGTYRFIAAKRFEKSQWPNRENWFSHSIENGAILWVPSTAAQMASGKKAKDATPDDLLTLIPLLDPVPKEQIIVEAKAKLRIGRDKVNQFLKVLLHQNKVFAHIFPRKGTNPETKYAKTSQP